MRQAITGPQAVNCGNGSKVRAKVMGMEVGVARNDRVKVMGMEVGVARNDY
jgi:hypothetical protein